MRSEALKAAQKAYRERNKGSSLYYGLRFTEDEADLHAHLKSQPNQRQYLLNLIRKDFEKSQK